MRKPVRATPKMADFNVTKVEPPEKVHIYEMNPVRGQHPDAFLSPIFCPNMIDMCL